MPTGYTCKIEDGSIKNGKDFLRWCVNAFLPTSRDHGMYMSKPDFWGIYSGDIEYHKEHLKDAQKKKGEYDSDTRNVQIEELEQEIAEREKHLEESKKLFEMYSNIKKEVESWNCSREFEGLKKFALEQIEISVPDIEWETEYIINKKKQLEKERTSVYDKTSVMSDIEWSIDYHTQEIKQIQEQIDYCNKYYDRFDNELESM